MALLLKKQTSPLSPLRSTIVPQVKPIGFIAHGAMIFSSVIKTVWHWMEKKYQRRKSCATIHKLMECSDTQLKDIGVRRDDLHYVLVTPSPIDPTTRLKLISLQARTARRRVASSRR